MERLGARDQGASVGVEGGEVRIALYEAGKLTQELYLTPDVADGMATQLLRAAVLARDLVS